MTLGKLAHETFLTCQDNVQSNVRKQVSETCGNQLK